MAGAEAMRKFEPDWIIAMGGGSPIDAAKAMWVFYEYPDTSFEEIIQPFSFPKLRKKSKIFSYTINIRYSNRSNSFFSYYR